MELTNTNKNITTPITKETLLNNFRIALTNAGFDQNAVSIDVANVDKFLNHKGNLNVEKYDLENYLRKLAEEKTPVPKLKEVSLSLEKFYKFLNVQIPRDSSLFHSLLMSEYKEGVVELAKGAAETGFFHSTVLPYILPFVGWLGIIGKLRLLYLLLLGMGSLATTSYFVQNPSAVTDARDSVKRFTNETVGQTVSNIVTPDNITISSTAPTLDPRFNSLQESYNSLSQTLANLQNQVNNLQTSVNNIDNSSNNSGGSTTVNNNTTNNSGTIIVAGTDFTLQINNLDSRLTVLEGNSSPTSGLSLTTSNFKVLDDGTTVLEYDTGGDLVLNMTSDLNVDGNVTVEDDLRVKGVLKVQDDDSDPGDTPKGGIYFNTDDNQLYVSDGSDWNQVGKTYSVSTDGGLQLVNDQFGLITCSSNEILKYVGGVWTCSSDSTGSAAFTSLTDVPSSYTGQGGRLVRVGVGETSLEFYDAAGVFWQVGGNTGTTSSSILGTSDTAPLYIGTSASHRITITGTGNVGVGTTNPTARFEVSGTSNLGGLTISSTGVITAGSWNGATITVPFGGTGATSFTANGLIYGNGTGPMQSVGVGTSGQILTINGSSQPIWASASSLVGGSFWGLTGNSGIAASNLLGTSDTAALFIGTSALHRMTILGNGNVGIGNTNPTNLLTVGANNNFSVDLNGVITAGSWNGATITVPFGGTGVASLTSNGLIYGNGTAPVQTVGVGTSGQILTINGSSQPIWANANTIVGASSTANLWNMDGNTTTSTSFLGTNDTNPLRIGTSGLERLRITPDGNIGIGTSSPTEKLHIANGGLLVDIPNLSVGGSVNPAGTEYDVAINGKYAYLASGTGGISILNLEIPGSPSLYSAASSSTAPADARGVDFAGRYAYIADGLNGVKAMDVSNPNAPLLAGTFPITGMSEKIDVSGKYAYVAIGTSGLNILDISNPSQMALVGSYNTGGTAVDVEVKGNFAYVSDSVDGLVVLDIRDVNNPVLAGTYNPAGPSSFVSATISGKTAYLADLTGTLTVVDISNPASITLRFSYSGTSPRNIWISGKYAYVASGSTTVDLYDISNPDDLTFVTSYDVSNNAVRAKVSGKYLYIVDSSSGLLAIDIGGADISALTAGNIGSDNVNISEDLNSRNAYIGSALNVGRGGIMSNGPGSFINTGVTGFTSDPTLNILSGSSNGALINILTGSTALYGLNVQSEGISKLFVSAGGNVGIGVTNPTNFKLEVAGNIGPSTSPVLVGVSYTSSLLDSGASAQASSIVIGSDGLPVISYYDTTNTSLKVAKCTNSTCSSVSAVTVDNSADVGSYSSIVLGNDGFPVIAYLDNTNSALKVAKCDDSSCTISSTTAVDTTNFAQDPTIGIGLDGYPIIGYADLISSDIEVVKCNNSTCSSFTQTTVDTTGDGNGSMAIGADGLALLVYETGSTSYETLKCLNLACTSSTITNHSTSGTVLNFSIQIPSDGLPIIAFHHNGVGDLYVAKCSDTNCVSTVTETSIDSSSADVGDYPSMAIGTDGLAIIAYKDVTNNDLKFAKCRNASCTSSTNTSVETSITWGTDATIAILPSGLPIAAADDTTSDNVRVVRCGVSNCSSSAGGAYSGGYDLGSVTKYWGNVFGLNFWAKEGMQISNFDVAEDYDTDDLSIEAGDVVALDSNNGGKLVKTNKDNKDKTIGIISTKPGLRLSNFEAKDRENQRPVALAGRVPVKISRSSFSIRIGDYITVSDDDGKGMKAKSRGYIIGKALENWSPENPTDKIQVFVNLGYYAGDTDVDFNELSGIKDSQQIKIDSASFKEQADGMPIALQNGIRVRGLATFENVDVSGNIKVLGDISALGEALSLQSGKVKITNDGQILSAEDIRTSGKIEASKIIINNNDPEAPAIGHSNISAGQNTVYINTKAANKDSRIITTLSTDTDKFVSLTVSKIEEGKGFEVKLLGDTTNETVGFDWLIVDEKKELNKGKLPFTSK